jgi:Domain of unknown function (DUF1707)
VYIGGTTGHAEDHVTGPDLRVGDADREAVAAALREHYAQGRLTLEEFNQRIEAAFAATMRSQLSALTRDLPPVAAAPARAPVSRPPVPGPAAQRERARHEHGPRSRGRLGLFPALIAAFTTWLLIIGLHLSLFPLPGKLAIFLLVFGMVRGIFRRIWRSGRMGGRGGCGRW